LAGLNSNSTIWCAWGEIPETKTNVKLDFLSSLVSWPVSGVSRYPAGILTSVRGLAGTLQAS